MASRRSRSERANREASRHQPWLLADRERAEPRRAAPRRATSHRIASHRIAPRLASPRHTNAMPIRERAAPRRR